MTKKTLFRCWHSGVFISSCLLILSGCSPGSDSAADAGEDELRFTIEVESPVNPSTRGAVVKPSDFKVYAFYGINNGAAFARNIVYTKTGDAWVYNKKPKRPNAAVNYYCLNMSYADVDISNVTMGETKQFDYTLPEAVENQKYLMYSSILNSTSADNRFTFSPALSVLYVSVYSTFSTVDVQIGGYTLHNAVKTGTFTFSDTKAKSGSWTLPESPEYTSYTRTFLDSDRNDDPFTVTATQSSNANYIPSADSAIFLLPQVLRAWNPADEATPKPSQGIAAHQGVLEIKCKVTDKDDPTHYRLGSATEYGSLFIPYSKTLKMGKTYLFIFDMADCYDENGELFKDSAGDDSDTPLNTVEVDTNRKFAIEIMNNWESTTDDIEIFSM